MKHIHVIKHLVHSGSEHFSNGVFTRMLFRRLCILQECMHRACMLEFSGSPTLKNIGVDYW